MTENRKNKLPGLDPDDKQIFFPVKAWTGISEMIYPLYILHNPGQAYHTHYCLLQGGGYMFILGGWNNI